MQLENIKKYQNKENVQKAFEISKAQIEAQSRYLRIKGKDIEQYQKILSYIIFDNPSKKLQLEKLLKIEQIVDEDVTYLSETNEILKIQNSECNFSYRHSLFSEKNYIILESNLKLYKDKKEIIQKKLEENLQNRKDKQPIEFPSAGSTFKRGEDYITAKLIDECGLKGYTIGGAQVSEKHAGFIINKGNSTADDVINLIKHVKKIVYKETGKKINLEVEIIGE